MLDFLIAFFEKGEIIRNKNLVTIDFTIDNQLSLDTLSKIDFNNITDERNEIITIQEIVVGIKYKFEIVLSSLRSSGFYYTCDDFIISNKKIKKENFYIFEIKSSNESNNIFIKNYLDIFSIIEFISLISIESGEEKIVFIENKYIKLLIDYSSLDISKTERLFDDKFIESFLNDYENSSKEIKVIFKNELLEFLEPIGISERFKYLFKNFKEFNEKCIVGYEFYLSNFSYNKLKTELNNAISDFHKNIRSVINDSQTKLIAIPASVMLVFTTVDTSEIIQDKNLFIFLASLIFALLMNFFIINQLKALSIIENNKNNYLQLFEKKKDSSSLSETLKSSTNEINDELNRQRCTLIVINIINWVIPIGLLFYIVTYIYYVIKEINF